MSKRVAVVTGSNKGIGLEVVRALCRQFDGDVYLTSRDVERGQQALHKLQQEQLKPLYHQLDLTDRESIGKLRTFMTQRYGGVDVLINNAGIAFKMADTTPFGIQAEVTMATNFYGTRDVSTELLPIVKPQGRVVNVSSVAGSMALQKCSQELQKKFRSSTITEEELVELMKKFVDDATKGVHSEQGWPSSAYGVSKIGVTVLSRIHARKLTKERPGDGILLNACCPGWVKTDMAGPNAPGTAEEGAVTPVYLALLPAGAEAPHGEFVSNKTVQKW
ncbi:carbonyl reductase [NADPH] 1 [Chiloscyllium plagiosum]|uniref:carbonyl reductase [NADPH] 1 n=1 Tax=Chiloscyllium plagiosum TaxID=36176 RepID=UPI001CB7CEE1|nr:carbonyl reductase [NADPH] 1 [Chiloscyllium plagiosum]